MNVNCMFGLWMLNKRMVVHTVHVQDNVERLFTDYDNTQ